MKIKFCLLFQFQQASSRILQHSQSYKYIYRVNLSITLLHRALRLHGYIVAGAVGTNKGTKP